MKKYILITEAGHIVAQCNADGWNSAFTQLNPFKVHYPDAKIYVRCGGQ